MCPVVHGKNGKAIGPDGGRRLSASAGDAAEVGKKAAVAARWSIVTQVVAKLISPVTTMILAHILAPDAFAVIATVTMVTSLAEMFSDAGFQKYLIQHEYENDAEYALSADVAFWTNLGVALLLWLLIGVFNEQIAVLVGNPGLGVVIVVASASLPLVSLSSVQTGVYQRALDFRTLFFSRVGSALLVLLVSVPMALLGFDFWSMVAGTIASNLFLAVWLTAQSPWKPKPRYSLAMLGQMFSFSAWTLLESFTIWLTTWAGTFVLGVVMSAAYLGMYKTSVSIVAAVTGLATGAINPIVFSSLSRLQNDRARFDSAFYLVQRYLGIVLVPLAASMFVFRDMMVGLFLGDQWAETALFFGLWAASSTVVVVFGHTASEAYRALGKPRISMLNQVLYMIAYVPALYLSALQGYWMFSIVVPTVRAVWSVCIHFLLCKFVFGLSPLKMLYGQRWIFFGTVIASAACYSLVLVCPNYWVQIPVFLLGVLVYLVIMLAVRDTRSLLADLCGKLGLGGVLRKVAPARILGR